MPIYAYRCTSCGHAQDVLQKISDPVLTVCSECGKPDFVKQVTAAGFQLKGSGWYVTDFRDGNKASDKGGDKAAAPATDGASAPTTATSTSTQDISAAGTASASSSAASATPAAPSSTSAGASTKSPSTTTASAGSPKS